MPLFLHSLALFVYPYTPYPYLGTSGDLRESDKSVVQIVFAAAALNDYKKGLIIRGRIVAEMRKPNNIPVVESLFDRVEGSELKPVLDYKYMDMIVNIVSICAHLDLFSWGACIFSVWHILWRVSVWMTA